jgi:tellurite resistance protein TehA-like permease
MIDRQRTEIGAPASIFTTRERAGGALQTLVAELSPAYFALVMATGILAVACDLLKMPVLPDVLLAINLVAYVVIWGLNILRVRYYPQRFVADFCSHQRGAGFFTAVAATSVLGTQLALQVNRYEMAFALWCLAVLLWLVLIYAVFTAFTIRRDKPAFEDGINGGWLTAVVATQSLVLLGGNVLPQVWGGTDAAMLILVLLWLAGGMLYIWMISLIFYRYTFFRFHPTDLTPPYWINMGAMAISTLAGALLIKQAETSPLLASMLPFLKGFTLFFWATATWWIPMLVILGIWRYVYHKVPLTYDPLNWGAVFPLAMYSAATYRLSEAFRLPFLMSIPRVFVGVALTAWLITFLGLILLLAFRTKRVAQGRGLQLAASRQN